MSNSQKISQFSAQTLLQDSDLVTFVRNGQNFNIKYSDFILSLGVTGTIKQVGDVTGVPVLNIPSPGDNQIRNIEASKGVKASISTEGGISLEWDVSQDGVGTPLTSGLANQTPVISSLVAGLGLSITKDEDVIIFTNTVDPASGLSNRIVVTQASDFQGALDSTKEYFIDGVVDMGSQSIQVPSGGLSLTGYNFDASKLISSATNYTMFISPVGGSGNIIGKDYALEVTGSGSQVYDIVSATGFDAFEFARINYNDCESLGVIDGYRQGLEVGTGRFGGKPQLTLAGTWVGGYFIDTSIIRNMDDGVYSLFAAGVDFVMQSRFRTNMNIDIPANASFLDFAAANFANPSTLQLDGCIVSREGVFNSNDTNIMPNISPAELVCDWMGNNGVSNTFIGGELLIDTEITTAIAVAGTFVDLAGTYTASDLQHFDEPVNGQLRHLGDSPVEYSVAGQLVLESTANNEVDLKVVIFRSSTTSFEDGKTQRRVINNLQGGRNVAYFVLIDNITLNKNDYVKLQVANSAATNDITAELDSFFSVSAR